MSSALLLKIIEFLIIPILGILTPYIVKFLQEKVNQVDADTKTTLASKYLKEIETVVGKCVLATKQTFVDALKQTDTFDKDAQEKALSTTLENIKSILSEEVKTYIGTITSDLSTYLVQFIEAEVSKTK